MREPLRNLLLLVLTSGLPPRIQIRGHSTLIATLIHGLTHALPMKLLPNLTFTTYESDTLKSETLISGSITRAELQDWTGIQVQPGLPLDPVPDDLQRYVDTAINVLVTGVQAEKLNRVIDEIDRREQASVEDLLELFKRRFQIGLFTSKRLEDTLLHPDQNLEDLIDPVFQEQAVRLLLNDLDYWEARGQKLFHNIQEWLISSEQSRSNMRGREAMLSCLAGMAERLYDIIQAEILQEQVPIRSFAVLIALHNPYAHRDIYQRMLVEFAQEPLYGKLKMSVLWPLHRWLLRCAGLLQPAPTWEVISPWLYIASWSKLAEVLKLDLPEQWETQMIYELLAAHREIPREACVLAEAHEAKFMSVLRTLLIEGSKTGKQGYIKAALRLFSAVIRFEEQGHSYPNRVGLLLAMLNALPENVQVIEALFAIVPFASPYQLSMPEFDQVVAGCRPEVLAVGGGSPSLMKYLNEYVLALTPKKLNTNTVKLLEQFQRASTTLPQSTAGLVNAWLYMYAFLTNQHFDDRKLRNIEPALAKLVPQLQLRGQDIWHTFVEELAPYLITLVETEYQLQEALDFFEGVNVVRPWELLTVLAGQAGQTYAKDHTLARLFPYVIVGLREYIHAGEKASAIDSYYQLLFISVSESELDEIDRAISSDVWAAPIQKEWRDWRERSKLLLGARASTTLFSQLTKSLANPKLTKEQQPRPTIDLSSEPQTPSSSNLHFPAQQDSEERYTRPLRRITDKTRFSFTIRDRKYAYYDRTYKQHHALMLVILPYWISIIENYTLRTNGSLRSEEKTLRILFDELQGITPQKTSKQLVQFLVDDYLIQLEIDKLHLKSSPNAVSHLNPEKNLPTKLEEFQNYVGIPAYDRLKGRYNEQHFKDVLFRLIRRYHFILFLNENIKGGWEKWISKERKNAKVVFTESG